MVNLSRTRERMLAEIGASASAPARPLDDPSDPAFLQRDEARLVVRDTWAAILPRLRPALVQRFADVDPERFIRDVGRPLKMGLGNADKRGHGRDPAKHITVEVVVTRAGAVIAVSDEGPGFDPATILRRCRRGETYFHHKGGGFKAFERAGSVISYENGGRTLLIRFLRPPGEAGPGLAVDPGFMSHVLGKLSMISKRGHALESCAIEELEAIGAPEVRYELRIRGADDGTMRTVLTGRLLSEAAARHEYTVAKRLYKGEFKAAGELCVPKPMHVFKLHPRLMLYRFDPG